MGCILRKRRRLNRCKHRCTVVLRTSRYHNLTKADVMSRRSLRLDCFPARPPCLSMALFPRSYWGAALPAVIVNILRLFLFSRRANAINYCRTKFRMSWESTKRTTHRSSRGSSMSHRGKVTSSSIGMYVHGSKSIHTVIFVVLIRSYRSFTVNEHWATRYKPRIVLCRAAVGTVSRGS